MSRTPAMEENICRQVIILYRLGKVESYEWNCGYESIFKLNDVIESWIGFRGGNGFKLYKNGNRHAMSEASVSENHCEGGNGTPLPRLRT